MAKKGKKGNAENSTLKKQKRDQNQKESEMSNQQIGTK